MTKKPLAILLILVVIAILLDRYIIAGLLPWVSLPGGLNPSFVFLDIPLSLPFVIDPIPVILLFSVFFWILIAADPARYGQPTGKNIRRRLATILAGATSLLLCMLVAGTAWHFTQEHVSRQVRNGIDSFGLQLDLYNVFPGQDIIHLKGSMIMLIAAAVGWSMFMHKLRIAMMPVPVRELTPLTEEKKPASRPEPVLPDVNLLPLAEPVRPRAVPTSVPVVAPQRIARVS